jgi:hypothetical protein
MSHPGGRPRVLIGTHTYQGSPSALRRQQEAIDSLLTLERAEAVNVQFEHQPHHVNGLRTLARLRHSSNSVSKRRGPSKAIVPEILDVLASEGAAAGVEYICFTNSDILFTQDAVDWIVGGGREAYIFSREDYDAETRTPIHVEIAGVDALAVRTNWWLANRRRFRRYIVGEACWDNVFTAIVMCHADAAIENRRPLVRHERHPMGPMPSAYFGEYVRMLTALDSGYFSLWYRYWNGLRRLRAEGATADAEAAWAREVFVWNPDFPTRAVQHARNVKAVLRHAWWKFRADKNGRHLP